MTDIPDYIIDNFEKDARERADILMDNGFIDKSRYEDIVNKMVYKKKQEYESRQHNKN